MSVSDIASWYIDKMDEQHVGAPTCRDLGRGARTEVRAETRFAFIQGRRRGHTDPAPVTSAVFPRNSIVASRASRAGTSRSQKSLAAREGVSTPKI